MADPPRRRDTAGVGADGASPPGMPRWVKLSLILTVVLVLLVVIVMLIAGGDHGPSRHAPGIQAPPLTAVGDLTPSGDGLGVHTPSAVGHR
jgi:hypothetical protein